jgi:hypothetical protein
LARPSAECLGIGRDPSDAASPQALTECCIIDKQLFMKVFTRVFMKESDIHVSFCKDLYKRFNTFQDFYYG